MKILVLKDVAIYGIVGGDELDNEVNSVLTDDQMTALVNVGWATNDLDSRQLRRVVWKPQIYRNEAAVVKDNSFYQLKVGIESSETWNINEWDLIVKGSDL